MQVLDWIQEQDWSDGSVGLWGLSYDATAALFTASEGHKAVKCCVCMFPFWDFYRSIAFPGGVSRTQLAPCLPLRLLLRFPPSTDLCRFLLFVCALKCELIRFSRSVNC